MVESHSNMRNSIKIRSIRNVEDHHFVSFFISFETGSLSKPGLADLATVVGSKLFNGSETHHLFQHWWHRLEPCSHMGESGAKLHSLGL